MAALSSLTILIFQLVLYSTAVTSVSFLELVPIAKEVDHAIEKMHLPERVKVAFSSHYINVGGYSKRFIELLASYRTMSSSPIRFNEKEKSILTLISSKEPLESKVRTQLKYYRKMQEVQCTDYFILYYNICIRKMRHIIQLVYNMIKMAYLGKFMVFPWLLKLHINLLTPSDWKHEAWMLHLMSEDLYNMEQYKKPLSDLIDMCMKHKYLEKKNSAKQCFNKVSEFDEFNTQLHIDFNKYDRPLPFFVDYLYLANIRRWKKRIPPITSISIEWDRIDDLFQSEIAKTTEQLSDEAWTLDPFGNMIFQKMFLEIVRLKLNCFVRFQLDAYLRVDVSKYKYRHDYLLRLDFFMSLISDILECINIEDKTLNIVLTLYSTHEKGKPKCEQIKKLLKIIITEIEKSLLHDDDITLADLSDDDFKTERAFLLVLGKIEKEFLEFGNFLEIALGGLSYNYLLLFVNGINNTKLAVFP